MKKPVALIIMDGVGLAPASAKNAVSLSNTPNLNSYIEKYPKLQMRTDGEFVGLPTGQMGNSEVGHLNIGAGRIVHQSLSKIDIAIEDGSFPTRPVILKAIENAKETNSAFHILGLISDGGVHSHIDHIIDLYKIVKDNGVEKVYVHGFLDGRDVPQKSAKTYIEQLKGEGIEVASLSGRYYAMDRDQRWERIQKAYDVLTSNESLSFENSLEYIEAQYEDGITDEFIVPAHNANIEAFISENDSVLFANFRPDRARQISHMLIEDSNLFEYKPEEQVKNIYFASMMLYTGIEKDVVFEHEELTNLIGQVLEQNNLKQIRAAETEKYPHVTFFMDGGKEIELKDQLRILVDSPKVETYDLQPEMSAVPLTDRILEEIEEYDTAIINFANGDMVGHTGSIPAVITAVETVDTQIGRLYEKIVEEMGGTLIIVADHGNADEMIDAEGNPMTKHSLNPVGIIITSNEVEFKEEFRTGKTIAKLADLAPTMLKLLKIEKPKEMTGNELVDFVNEEEN